MRALLLLLALAGFVSTAHWQNGDNGVSNNWNVNEGKRGFAPASLAYAYSIMLAFTEAFNSPNKAVALKWVDHNCDYHDCNENAKESCIDFVFFSNNLPWKIAFEMEWSHQFGDIMHIDVYLTAKDAKTDPTKLFLKIEYNTKTKKIVYIRNLVCK